MFVKSLLPFVLAALVLDGVAHPVHHPLSDVSKGVIPRSSTNDTSSPMPMPLHVVKAASHGAAPPLPLSSRQEDSEPSEEGGEDDGQAESTGKRPSHRKPKPSKDDKPFEELLHLHSRAENKQQQHSNATLPVHVPRSTNTTSSTNATSPVHVLPRGQNSTMSLPVHVPRTTSTNSTMTPVQNSTMPLHVAQKNETTHLHASRSQSQSGANDTKAAPVHIDVGPRSSTHSPADILLNDAPHHPRRATVETHVPAEKVTHLVPGHHRREEHSPEGDEKPETDDAPRGKPTMPFVVPRHSTGVAVADTVLHSDPHAPRQDQHKAQRDC